VNRFHIVGRKNSGKTTLVVELVRHLSAQGHRVGTVKHTHHHHELDTPGKDSYRHRQAGAVVVGILAPKMNAVFQPTTNGETSPEEKAERYEWLAANMTDCDVVLVEGDLRTEAPKLEVWRAAGGEAPIAADNATISFIATDDPIELAAACNTTPCVHPRQDVAGLADKIMAQLAQA
jgi:molybdopterin-guanine dinucleotide biosynthesis protein MobB